MKAQKLKVVDPVLGYSDTSTVKLDIDNVPLKTVKYWAFKTLRWFKRDHLGRIDLEGFLIVKSSLDCYHVIFNRPVSWAKNLHITAWVAQQSKNRKVTGYLVMQCIKESSTLRLSPKRDKPFPRVVFRWGRQDGEIKNYLKYRRMIQRFSLPKCSENQNGKESRN